MKQPGKEKEKSSLEKVQAVISIMLSCIVSISIIVGGIWWIAQSEASPKANISHVVTHRKLTDNWVWVHVAITTSNRGKRPLDLKCGTFRIQGILPLDKKIDNKLKFLDKYIDNQLKFNVDNLIPQGETVIKWPQIGNVYEKIPIDEKIDPGESEKFNVEFIIPSYMRTIKIYSHFEEALEIGWTATTIYQLDKQEFGHD